MTSDLTIMSLKSRINKRGGKARCINCGELTVDTAVYAIVNELLPRGLFCEECKRNRNDAELLEAEWRGRLWEKIYRENILALLSRAGVPPWYRGCTLENFQPNPPDSRPSFITGPTGTGKTHLAVGFLRVKLLDKGGDEGRFLRTVDLFQNIRRSFSEKSGITEHALLELYGEKTPFLVLDDLGAENLTGFVVQTLYDLIDNRYSWRLPTIITSNLSLEQLASHYGSHGDRLASRIAGMGPTLALKGKDRRWQK